MRPATKSMLVPSPSERFSKLSLLLLSVVTLVSEDIIIYKMKRHVAKII